MQTLDDLTAELTWIRRLAKALVKDAAAADDIAQDAWLAAAGKVPQDRPLRPWLSRVVLNAVRMRARSAKRRAVHEAQVENGEAAPGANEIGRAQRRPEMRTRLDIEPRSGSSPRFTRPRKACALPPTSRDDSGASGESPILVQAKPLSWSTRAPKGRSPCLAIN